MHKRKPEFRENGVSYKVLKVTEESMELEGIGVLSWQHTQQLLRLPFGHSLHAKDRNSQGPRGCTTRIPITSRAATFLWGSAGRGLQTWSALRLDALFGVPRWRPVAKAVPFELFCEHKSVQVLDVSLNIVVSRPGKS